MRGKLLQTLLLVINRPFFHYGNTCQGVVIIRHNFEMYPDGGLFNSNYPII